MNLKTHLVYPEIMIDFATDKRESENPGAWIWSAKLLGQSGFVVDVFTGRAVTYKEAEQAAIAAVNAAAPKYLLKGAPQ